MKSFINFLPPWVETNIQPAFYDKESGTVLQQTARMYAKVNQLIRKFNELSEEVQSYIKQFIDLKDYVDTYFDNLDVQEEINNKLDAMAEDGTLQEIVASYLQANVTWTFDSVADMVSANNLIDGSYAQTLGYYSANDGGQAIYKISETNDTPDGGSVITLTNGLQAHLIVEESTVNIKQFGAKGDDSTNDTSAIQSAVNYAKVNNYSIFIPTGTFLVSKITVDSRLEIFGVDRSSILKSIGGNTENSILYIVNDGIRMSHIHDFMIDGNKDNVSTECDGIRVYVTSADYRGDKYLNIENMYIYATTGNGVKLDSNGVSTAIREVRLTNVFVNQPNKSGFYFNQTTDSIISRCTVASAIQYGFYMPSGGSNKFDSCKAFYCGIGDGSTIEDLIRIPADAFTATSDATPVADKNYYIRTGTGVENDYYEFTLFTGGEFDPAETYYELTTFYSKRYAGFFVSTSASVLVNCESQDNMGDGYDLSGSFTKLSNCSADNNGLLLVSGTEVSYASQSKTQLYYGMYIHGWEIEATNCNFLNHRNSAIGKSQRGCAYIRGGGENKVCGSQGQQVVETITIQKVQYVYNLSSTLNNVEWCYNIPLSKIQMLDADLTWQGESNCLFYYKNNTVYFRLIVKKTGGILNSWHEVNLIKLPSGYRPKKYLPLVGWLTTNSGYSINGYCSMVIYENGNISVRHTDNSLDSYEQLVIEGQFTTK